MKHKKQMFTAFLILLLFIRFGCSKNETPSGADSNTQNVTGDFTKKKEKPKVTFVELGSVDCIPCKMMQPVMKAIEEEFGDQIEVLFFDVRKDPESGQKYGIKLIPTQVFLDESGKEFFRHQGFFPQEDIKNLLVEYGLEIVTQVDIEK